MHFSKPVLCSKLVFYDNLTGIYSKIKPVLCGLKPVIPFLKTGFSVIQNRFSWVLNWFLCFTNRYFFRDKNQFFLVQKRYFFREKNSLSWFKTGFIWSVFDGKSIGKYTWKSSAKLSYFSMLKSVWKFGNWPKEKLFNPTGQGCHLPWTFHGQNQTKKWLKGKLPQWKRSLNAKTWSKKYTYCYFTSEKCFKKTLFSSFKFHILNFSPMPM